MQSEGNKPGHLAALGALVGLISGLIIRWMTEGGIGTVLLCGIGGAAIGLAFSLGLRRWRGE